MPGGKLLNRSISFIVLASRVTQYKFMPPCRGLYFEVHLETPIQPCMEALFATTHTRDLSASLKITTVKPCSNCHSNCVIIKAGFQSEYLFTNYKLFYYHYFIGPEWQKKVVETLMTSLPTPNSEEVPSAAISTKGRKRKAVNYENNGMQIACVNPGEGRGGQ